MTYKDGYDDLSLSFNVFIDSIVNRTHLKYPLHTIDSVEHKLIDHNALQVEKLFKEDKIIKIRKGHNKKDGSYVAIHIDVDSSVEDWRIHQLVHIFMKSSDYDYNQDFFMVKIVRE